MADIGIVEKIYDILGKPSLISATAAILSGFAVATIRKNKMRNEFIDDLMKKTLLDKREFDTFVETLKEIIDLKFTNLDKRIEDLKDLLESK